MKVVGVIQARMGSSRLPGKVMKPLAGEPMLMRMIQRVRAAAELSEVVVATTADVADTTIRQMCSQKNVPFVTGHATDLLSRHIEAGRIHKADVVVKIPSDCPLIDPRIIDRVLAFYRRSSSSFDFVSNLHPATYPDGNDVEVVPMNVLEIAHAEANQLHEREHTTPFIWDHPERFRVGNVTWETGLDYSMSHRMTVDYAEDYEFVRTVFESIYGNEDAPFSLGDIMRFLKQNPDVVRINSHFAGVNWYRNNLSELRTITRRQTVVFEDD